MLLWNKKKRHADILLMGQVRTLMIELQLPEIVLDLFDGKCSDDRAVRLLGNQYQKPYTFFDQPLKQVIEDYRVDRYLPLLAVWQSEILAYDRINKAFVRYHLEYFREPDLRFLTWDGIMLREIIHWWELEWRDEDIIYLGGRFGMKHTEKLIPEIALHGEQRNSYQDHIKWENDLLDRIGGFVEGKR